MKLYVGFYPAAGFAIDPGERLSACIFHTFFHKIEKIAKSHVLSVEHPLAVHAR